MYIIDPNTLYFPHPDSADSNGVLAVGGDLHPDRLLLAYQYGIFPWYNPDEPIIWWHPDPRFVLFPADVRVTKSMRPYFNQAKYRVTFDRDFTGVLEHCRHAKRKGDPGTWISDSIVDSYRALHDMGYAHSVEVWDDDNLVGGIYGVSLGRMFCGESMFSDQPNASKVALITLARVLQHRGFSMIDCQISNPHLKSMGGCYISRASFMSELRRNIFYDTIKGSWSDIYPDLDLRTIL